MPQPSDLDRALAARALVTVTRERLFGCSRDRTRTVCIPVLLSPVYQTSECDVFVCSHHDAHRFNLNLFISCFVSRGRANVAKILATPDSRARVFSFPAARSTSSLAPHCHTVHAPQTHNGPATHRRSRRGFYIVQGRTFSTTM